MTSSVFKKSSFCIVMLAGLVGCAHDKKTGPTPQAGVPTAPAVIEPLPAQGFSREWATNLPLGGSTATELHLRENAVFVYSADHKSYLIDRASGQLVSITQVTSPRTVLRPPVVLGDRIVYPTNSTLEVYNRKGRLLKSINLGFAIRSDATGSAPSTIYVGSDYGNGGRLSSVNIDKDFGFLKWELNTFGGVSSKPTFVQNVVYAAGEDGRVYAVNENRSGAWGLEGSAFVTDGPIYADLTSDEFGIYVASFDGKLYCLDRSTGKIKWMWYATGPLTETPVATASTVYEWSKGQGLVALDKTNGDYTRKARWTAPDVQQFLSEDEKHTYVLKTNHTIAALDKATGNELFTSTRSDFVSFASNNKTVTIYATTGDGRVMAIKPILRAGLTGELVLKQSDDPVAMAW